MPESQAFALQSTTEILKNKFDCALLRHDAWWLVFIAVLIGLTAPVVGTYLVQKRLSLLGDGLGHVALTGVAVGLTVAMFQFDTFWQVGLVAAAVAGAGRSSWRPAVATVAAARPPWTKVRRVMLVMMDLSGDG